MACGYVMCSEIFREQCERGDAEKDSEAAAVRAAGEAELRRRRRPELVALGDPRSATAAGGSGGGGAGGGGGGVQGSPRREKAGSGGGAADAGVTDSPRRRRKKASTSNGGGQATGLRRRCPAFRGGGFGAGIVVGAMVSVVLASAWMQLATWLG